MPQNDGREGGTKNKKGNSLLVVAGNGEAHWSCGTKNPGKDATMQSIDGYRVV